MGASGINRLIQVTQMKAEAANDEALDGADKQKKLVENEKQEQPGIDLLESGREVNLFNNTIMSLGESQPGMAPGENQIMSPGEQQPIMIAGESQGGMVPAEGQILRNMQNAEDFAALGESIPIMQPGELQTKGEVLPSSNIVEGNPTQMNPGSIRTMTESNEARVLKTGLTLEATYAHNQNEFNKKLARTLDEMLHLLDGDSSDQETLKTNIERLGLSDSEAQYLIRAMERKDAMGMGVAVTLAGAVAKAQMGDAVLADNSQIDLHQLAQLAFNAGTLHTYGALERTLDLVTQTSEFGNQWSAEDLNKLATNYQLPFGTDAVDDFVSQKLNLQS